MFNPLYLNIKEIELFENNSQNLNKLIFKILKYLVNGRIIIQTQATQSTASQRTHTWKNIRNPRFNPIPSLYVVISKIMVAQRQGKSIQRQVIITILD